MGDGTQATAAQNRVIVIYNAGNATFFQQTVINNVGDGPMDVTAGDFDLDGDLDLAVVEFSLQRCHFAAKSGAG